MSKTDWRNLSIKEFAGIISSHLKDNNIDAVLVGGACVSIYSENEYLSHDLDYSSYNNIAKEIRPCLESIGFLQTAPNRFENKKCEFYIEFVTTPISLGSESPVTRFNEIDTGIGKITLLTPADCVKDRLSAYYHWHDPQSLDQALMVAKNQKINLKEIEIWSKKEKKLNEFKNFKEAYESDQQYAQE